VAEPAACPPACALVAAMRDEAAQMERLCRSASGAGRRERRGPEGWRPTGASRRAPGAEPAEARALRLDGEDQMELEEHARLAAVGWRVAGRWSVLAEASRRSDGMRRDAGRATTRRDTGRVAVLGMAHLWTEWDATSGTRARDAGGRRSRWAPRRAGPWVAGRSRAVAQRSVAESQA
jgi:hypothetical protein